MLLFGLTSLFVRGRLFLTSSVLAMGFGTSTPLLAIIHVCNLQTIPGRPILRYRSRTPRLWVHTQTSLSFLMGKLNPVPVAQREHNPLPLSLFHPFAVLFCSIVKILPGGWDDGHEGDKNKEVLLWVRLLSPPRRTSLLPALRLDNLGLRFDSQMKRTRFNNSSPGSYSPSKSSLAALPSLPVSSPGRKYGRVCWSCLDLLCSSLPLSPERSPSCKWTTAFLGLWRKSDSRSDPVFLVLGRIFRVSWLEALLIGACLAYVPPNQDRCAIVIIS